MTFDEIPHTEDYFVSTDPRLLDTAFLLKEISISYFGSWRTPITILRSIEHSLCFGLYRHLDSGDVQVGFARVVTDYATFAWICDVIITGKHRGKGLGKFLMHQVMEHPDVKPRACLLSTHDAHGLYRKFGFVPFEAMKRLPKLET